MKNNKLSKSDNNSKNTSDEQFDVIVIGGGPSGMMAAGGAAKRGKKVLLLEKNESLGKKLKITGGGRCNITNEEFDNKKLLKHYGKAEPFLYSPFSQYDVKSTFSFFEKMGLPLVTEARKRVFPKTQKAFDVCKVMEKYINNNLVTIKTNSPVRKILTENKKIIGVKTDKTTYTANNYVIATGGASHPETGSTGDGFRWLKDLGHTVKSPTPNVVPLAVKEKWVKDLSGRDISFMKITFYVNGKKAFTKKGKILFTHFGVSGPLILNSAHKVADLLHEGEVTAKIDCYPDTNIGDLEKNILKIFDANKNKAFKNVVDEITPNGLSNTIIGFHIVPDVLTKVHSIKKEERKKIVNALKGLPLTITGLMGMDRAVVSDGGIIMEEIDTKTMRSKVYDNLFLTGDILNINRPSGGYSLQLCWTTGYVVGKNV
jgi:predicted Rossmann fold flavoprotein